MARTFECRLVHLPEREDDESDYSRNREGEQSVLGAACSAV
jgi:hypothetical protein